MKKLHFVFLLFGSVILSSCEEEEGCSGNLTLNTSQVTPSFCGQNNGSFLVSASGQDGSVTYQLNNGSFQSDTEFTALAPGNYQVTVRDEAGCTATAMVTIAEENKTLNTTITATEGTCGEPEGALTVEVGGGSAPYTYSLDGTSFQAENQFMNLEPGAYTVTIRDQDGCTDETAAVVPSDISFSNTINNIISTNCAVSNCHDGSQSIPNFSDKSVIISHAGEIKTRTGSKAMPPPSSGRSLTDDEIEQIACWVDDGAPDN